jgi:uncharacterized RDD family membrane protein YckC
LVDGVIMSIIGTVLFFATTGPAYFSLIRLSVDYPSQVTSSQSSALFGQFLVGFLIFSLISLAIGIFFWWWLATKGKTIGYAIFGLRLVSVEDGQPLGWGKTCLRWLLTTIGSSLTGGILGILFLLSPLFDNVSGWHRAWQDKIFDGVVINHKLGRDTLNQSK